MCGQRLFNHHITDYNDLNLTPSFSSPLHFSQSSLFIFHFFQHYWRRRKHFDWGTANQSKILEDIIYWWWDEGDASIACTKNTSHLLYSSLKVKENEEIHSKIDWFLDKTFWKESWKVNKVSFFFIFSVKSEIKVVSIAKKNKQTDITKVV